MSQKNRLILRIPNGELILLASFKQSTTGEFTWDRQGYLTNNKFRDHWTWHNKKDDSPPVLHSRITATAKATEEDKEKVRNTKVTDSEGNYIKTVDLLKEPLTKRPIPAPTELIDWRHIEAFGYSISGLKEKAKRILVTGRSIIIEVHPTTTKIYMGSYGVNPNKEKEFLEHIRTASVFKGFEIHFCRDTNPMIVILSKQVDD